MRFFFRGITVEKRAKSLNFRSFSASQGWAEDRYERDPNTQMLDKSVIRPAIAPDTVLSSFHLGISA